MLEKFTQFNHFSHVTWFYPTITFFFVLFSLISIHQISEHTHFDMVILSIESRSNEEKNRRKMRSSLSCFYRCSIEMAYTKFTIVSSKRCAYKVFYLLLWNWMAMWPYDNILGTSNSSFLRVEWIWTLCTTFEKTHTHTHTQHQHLNE